MTEAKPPTRRQVQIALGLTAVLLFAVILLTAALNGVRRSDFTGYYMSGLIIRRGRASRLYDLGEQAGIERQLFKRGDLLPNPHPPFEALGFAALARLSLVEAYIVWGTINVLLWLFFQHLLRPHAPIPMNTYSYFGLCSLFVPLGVALLQGQTSVFLLLLFSLTFICLQGGRDFRAGVFLGLGLFKFAVVLPFALICLLRGKWRLMAGFAAAASLLGVLSVMAVGLSGMRTYASLMVDVVRDADNPAYVNMRAWEKMPTLRGFFATLLTGSLSTAFITVLVAAVSVSLILYVSWRWGRSDRSPRGNSLGLTFAAALVVSQVTAPHLYLHDLTLMLLAVLLVIGSSPWSQRSGQRILLIATMVILYFPPVYILLLRWQALYLLAPVLVVFALGAMSLARRAGPPASEALSGMQFSNLAPTSDASD